MPSISYYKNVKQTESNETINLDEFIEDIRNGLWQDEVLKIRTIQDKELRREAKTRMPNVTISGIFGKREDSDCKLHSGFIAMDLDDLHTEVEATKVLLASDPYVYSAFTSISGTGLCLLFKIDPEKHREAFEGIADYLIKAYQVIADPTGINRSRTRFVSYDPHLYVHQKSLLFKKYLPKPKVRKVTATIFVKTEFDDVIRSMADHNISCVDDYRDWRDIGFGLADQFGEAGRDYFHALSSCSSKYERSMCDRQYTHSLKRRNRGGNKITIATIYWHAKQAGISIYSEKTKRIASATSAMKKTGLSADAIAENLKNYEGLEDAGDIIKQAFAANTSFESEGSIIDNVRIWLKNNYQLKRNVLTQKIENNGVTLEETDFNTMFLEAKHLFAKLDYQLFERILFSRNTPDYNPVKDIIESVPWDGIERLNLLGSCINSETGTIEWRCKMVRKWIIGIIASVYGGVNELNFILVGGKNTGKTEFFKRLLPQSLSAYFAMSQLNRGKDDEILMCNKLVILNDEYGGKNRMDERNEKRLMSSNQFDLRLPYGRSNLTLRRIASLGGTCNEIDVLDDPTGNRRIIVIEASGRFNYGLYNSIDKQQLLSEALAAYRNGEKPELEDEDIIHLELTTDSRYSKISMESEMIQKFFLPPEKCEPWSFMTTTEVKLKLEILTRSQLNINKIGSQLRKLGYKRVGKSGSYGYEIAPIPDQSNYSSYIKT